MQPFGVNKNVVTFNIVQLIKLSENNYGEEATKPVTIGDILRSHVPWITDIFCNGLVSS